MLLSSLLKAEQIVKDHEYLVMNEEFFKAHDVWVKSITPRLKHGQYLIAVMLTDYQNCLIEISWETFLKYFKIDFNFKKYGFEKNNYLQALK